MEIAFLIGRIIFGGYFINSAVNHFKNHEQMVGYAQSKGVSNPAVMVPLTGVLLLLGGLGVVLGVTPRFALLLLVIFLLPTTVMMHDFWNAEGEEQMNEQINFFKNFALIGACLMLMAIPLPWALSLL